MKEKDIFFAYQEQLPVQISSIRARYRKGLESAQELLNRPIGLWLDIDPNRGFGLAELDLTPLGNVIAVDLDRRYLDEALETNPNIKGAIMDGCRLGFSNQSFDVVSGFEIIEHIPESQQIDFMTEVSRVLKPGGLLILSTPNKLSTGKRSMSPDHQKELTWEELKKLLEENFEISEVLGQGFFNKSTFHRLWRQIRQSHFLAWVYYSLLPLEIRSGIRDKTMASQDMLAIRKPKEDELERVFFVICRKK